MLRYPKNNWRKIMAQQPQQIMISLTAEQAGMLEELKKLTSSDTTSIIRRALEDLYRKVQEDEEGKQLARINALLDVQ
jgi:hypothetical protein